jgi:membrane fusion protein (multidrug efflux system)
VTVRLSAALAVLLLGCLACGSGDDADAEKGFPVIVARIETFDIVERIEATGELEAKEHAEVAAEVAGRITEILIDEGARVERGAEVLSIDPERRTLERDSSAARVDEARAELREAEREFRRVRDLRKRKVASQTQLDQEETDLKLAKSRLLAAEAGLGMVERALRDATVTAPFSGYIAHRKVSRGEYVQPGRTLFELVALDPIEVEFQVPEVDSGRVALDQTVDVRLAPFPEEIFPAVVTFVSPTIDVRTRTLRVKAQLENLDGQLRPGLFARVDLGVSQRDGVMMIPEDAVLQRADGEVVFRANAENRVERVIIETGTHRDGMVEVTTGLSPGQRIVSRGQAWLSDGQLVTPRNPDGTLATQRLPAVAEGARDGAGNVP